MKRDISVGFYGQSGSGKTTIIKNLIGSFNGRYVIQHTGIIRSLFEKNAGRYTNPESLLKEYYKDTDQSKNYILEQYIRSQFQLLNDFSTEVFTVNNESCVVPAIMVFDRSPVDFYVLTLCGLNYLMDKLVVKKLNDVCAKLLNLMKKTTEHNTSLLFDSIIQIKPWNNNSTVLNDGVRDQYLTEYYVGENWYGNFSKINMKNTKVYNLDESNVNLNSRVSEITNFLVIT